MATLTALVSNLYITQHVMEFYQPYYSYVILEAALEILEGTT